MTWTRARLKVLISRSGQDETESRLQSDQKPKRSVPDQNLQEFWDLPRPRYRNTERDQKIHITLQNNQSHRRWFVSFRFLSLIEHLYKINIMFAIVVISIMSLFFCLIILFWSIYNLRLHYTGWMIKTLGRNKWRVKAMLWQFSWNHLWVNVISFCWSDSHHVCRDRRWIAECHKHLYKRWIFYLHNSKAAVYMNIMTFCSETQHTISQLRKWNNYCKRFK